MEPKQNLNSIYSDYADLKTVIINFPASSLANLLPENVREGNKKYLLMDDLLHVPSALNEHLILQSILRTSAEVLSFQDIVCETLLDKDLREQVICELGISSISLPNDPKLFVEILFSGRYENKQIFHPAPNSMFTRDIATVVGNAIILCYGAKFSEYDVKRPREREMYLMRHVIRHHDIFKNYKIIDINKLYTGSNQLSCEGGDIQILNSDIVMIGASQRTNKKAIKIMAPLILEQGFKYLFIVELPKERATMHLDTVCTVLGKDELMCYAPVVNDSKLKITIIDANGNQKELIGCIVNVLSEYANINYHKYHCGGDDPIIATREQWTDGANLLAIAPYVLIGYDRNVVTSDVLKDAGYKVCTADEFSTNPDFSKKTLILVPSAELSRGRGGPRCLTLPISRR